MRILLRSTPVLVVLGAALAGCNRPTDPDKGGPAAAGTPAAHHPVVLEVGDMT